MKNMILNRLLEIMNLKPETIDVQFYESEDTEADLFRKSIYYVEHYYGVLSEENDRWCLRTRHNQHYVRVIRSEAIGFRTVDFSKSIHVFVAIELPDDDADELKEIEQGAELPLAFLMVPDRLYHLVDSVESAEKKSDILRTFWSMPQEQQTVIYRFMTDNGHAAKIVRNLIKLVMEGNCNTNRKEGVNRGQAGILMKVMGETAHQLKRILVEHSFLCD